MIAFPNIDPVAVSLGPLQIHWYGLMYLGAFAFAYWLASTRAKKENSGWTIEQVSDLIFYGALGVVLGGRFGYVFFYNFDKFLDNPLWLFKVWEGGMSFHGGMLGVILAVFLYGRKINKTFFEMTDFTAPIVPIGLALGRIGNFIGGELWGKATDVPWAMKFPGDPEQLARHPSQLYQFALEGMALFIILWWYSAKPRPRMAVSGLFLIGYGFFRFVVEFFRQPDSHIGYEAFGWLTRGQILSTPMILIGVAFMIVAYRQQSLKLTKGS